MRTYSLPVIVTSLLVLAACNVGSDDVGSDNTSTIPTAVWNPSRSEVLARDLCSGCHGEKFGGTAVDTLICPSLKILAHYSIEEFTNLLRLGVARSGDQVNRAMLLNAEIDASDIPALLEYLQRTVSAP